MDWGIIIAVFALLIAQYGAGLATWQEIKSWRQQGSRLQVTLFGDRVTVANPTLRPVTIASLIMRFQSSSNGEMFLAFWPIAKDIKNPQLPASLEPGGMVRLSFDYHALLKLLPPMMLDSGE